MKNKHWSQVEYLHLSVKNPNILIRGQHSYYSDCWDDGFEHSVVRYLHGDNVSQQWEPLGHIDQLIIGDYVCIGAEAIILMGGNHNHSIDFISLYPFMSMVKKSYQPRGNTVLNDGCWLGMRCMVMPGVTVGEGAVIAAGSIVTKDIPAYAVVGGNPARVIKYRFSENVITRIVNLRIYKRPDDEIEKLIPLLSSDDISTLETALTELCPWEKDT
ncbi:TPA: CatB-related O-acetyltransferase [Yersinia enterocolitica]|nr:CatB-related O-acetyltransferase [Yersinia enterocolitica]HDL7504611.1 CatB-related O-acetyltransferase [Yersinia enterocolitica]